MLGQHILVLTRSIGQQFNGLCFKDVNDNMVTIRTSREQTVNQNVVEFQTIPMVLFCDVIDQQGDEIDIPENALISVLPVSSNSVEKIINAGQIEEWIETLRQDLL